MGGIRDRLGTGGRVRDRALFIPIPPVSFGLLPSTVPPDSDHFQAHNQAAEEVWAAYRARKPIRVPVSFGLNPRIILLDPALNHWGYSFQDYFSDPRVMAQVQVHFDHYVAHNIWQDAKMGLPDDGWGVWVDFQNIYDQAYLGCEVRYLPGEVPDTFPLLKDDARKRLLFDRGLPGPLEQPWVKKNLDYYEVMNSLKDKEQFWGRPMAHVSPSMLGTDGPFTCACSLRGATEICTDIYEDPDYVHRLLDFITQAIIARIQALRKLFGYPEKPDAWGFADDSIALLSTQTYTEFVLPYHRRLMQELSVAERIGIHLCGDASHHFRFLRDQLSVYSFDTGYPVDFASLRRELGPEVEISGGPAVQLVLGGTAEEVFQESRRILESGVMEGGRFVLREGNNVPPRTPLENLHAIYRAAKEHGRYM